MTRTVIVTGSARGIGEATARLFAIKGWQVAATARDPSAIGAWAQAPNVAAMQMDVTDSESIRKAVEETKRRFGTVDVLVNNAGTGLAGPVEGVTKEEFTSLFDLNLLGPVAVTQAVLPVMRQQASGVIVNVSSAVGRVGLPFLAPYCASKYALEGLSEAMAFELAPFGVRVKLIEPGGVKTGFEHRWTESPPYAKAASAARDRYSAGSRKAAGPEAVAEAIFRAATDDKPRLRYTANGAGWILALNRLLPQAAWRILVT